MIDLIEQRRPQLIALCRRYGVSRLDLFGSALRDDFNAVTSDLDFLVDFEKFDGGGAADRYFGLLEGLEELFSRKVDLVSDRAIRNPYFRFVVDRDRVPLYAA